MAKKSKEEEFTDLYIARALRMYRAFEGEAEDQAAKLGKAHLAVLALVKKEYDFLSAAKLRDLNSEIKRTIEAHFSGTVVPEVQAVANKVIANEIRWNGYALDSVIIGRDPNLINSPAVADRAWRKPYQGASFEQWFQNANTKVVGRVQATVTRAYVEGVPTQQAVQEVSSFLNQNKNDVKTLVRSYLQQAANEARDEFFDQNSDIVAGFIWDSTLDNRTTWHVCGIRDQARYTVDRKPIGHSMPWGAGPGRIHFNCRSTSVPRVKGLDFGPVPRAAVSAGHNYDKGDNLTATGKVRKPTKPNREKGIYKIEQVTTETKFEEWLKKQDLNFIADTLKNKQKAEIFKAGKKSLKQLAADKLPNLRVSEL